MGNMQLTRAAMIDRDDLSIVDTNSSQNNHIATNDANDRDLTRHHNIDQTNPTETRSDDHKPNDSAADI
jgi:hypothetical protein